MIMVTNKEVEDDDEKGGDQSNHKFILSDLRFTRKCTFQFLSTTIASNGENVSNAHKRNSLSSEENDVSLERLKGDDGYYYECVACDFGGDLFCCESCSGTKDLYSQCDRHQI